MLRSIIELLRPQQWVKNFFVFLPLFFGRQLFDIWCLKEAIVTFIAFSLMASAVYSLNDLVDIEADRLHPKKRTRPLASGKIKPAVAIVIMSILVIAGLNVSYFWVSHARNAVSIIILFYFCLNILYCLKLKQYAIIDVFIVSFGFVLRLLAGGLACDIKLSPWIVLMTFLLALFLAFAKRRDDVVMYENENIKVRKNVVRYNLAFMNQTLGLISAIMIVCYIMYCMSPEVVTRQGTEYIYITSIFVLAALLRYLQLSIVDQKSGSPTKVLLKDRFIQICVLLWIVSFIVILYL